MSMKDSYLLLFHIMEHHFQWYLLYLSDSVHFDVNNLIHCSQRKLLPPVLCFSILNFGILPLSLHGILETIFPPLSFIPIYLLFVILIIVKIMLDWYISWKSFGTLISMLFPFPLTLTFLDQIFPFGTKIFHFTPMNYLVNSTLLTILLSWYINRCRVSSYSPWCICTQSSRRFERTYYDAFEARFCNWNEVVFAETFSKFS